jgi:hypothetical protein
MLYIAHVRLKGNRQFCIRKLPFNVRILRKWQQDRQCAYNVTLRRVSVTFVVVEKR